MNTKNTSTLGAAMLGAAAVAAPASAAVIAEWTFETSQPAGTATTSVTGIAPETGTGSGSGVHASNSTFDNPAGNGSVESFSSNTWAVGDYYQFQVDLSAMDPIADQVLVTWDQTRSGTGPEFFDFAYSTDGTTFTTFLDNYQVLTNATATGRTAWSSGTPRQAAYTFVADLATVGAIEGDSSVYFRLVADSAAGGTGGTNRLDNFKVEVIPVPEPAGLALIGIGIGALGLRRRRR